MRVLIVNVLFLGGQTTHSIELAVGLKRAGMKVSFLILGEGEYPKLAEEFRKIMAENDIPVYSRKTVVKELKNIDLIHAHSAWSYPLALRWKDKFKIPVVFTIHGLGVKHEDRLQKADAIIAVGERTRDSLPLSIRNRAVVITNGVDLIKYVPKEKKQYYPLRLLYLGRLSKGKEAGLMALADATELLNMELLVATDYEIPLNSHCKYLGWQEDIVPVLEDADIVFACGRALREGMAMGLAAGVLGERYFGHISNKEMFTGNIDLSGLTGVVPSKEILCQDLLLLKAPSYLKECQKAARALAEKHYSLDAMVLNTLKIYENCLS